MKQDWFSVQELATLSLPGLPNTKRGINRAAKSDGWHDRRAADGSFLARHRRAKGGGTEYHYSILPTSAVVALVRQGLVAATRDIAQRAEKSQDWLAFEALPKAARDKAKGRLDTLKKVESLQKSGMTKKYAVSVAAAEAGVGASTVFNWLKLCAGKRRTDWLPALAGLPLRGGPAMS